MVKQGWQEEHATNEDRVRKIVVTCGGTKLPLSVLLEDIVTNDAVFHEAFTIFCALRRGE